jgi:hypothetical protein
MRIAPFAVAATIALAASAAVAQDIEALERQLDKARESAPLVVKPFMAVTRPAKHFGDYEARANNTFSRGEQMHFYGEPRNIAVRNAKGEFEPAVEVDIEVKPEKGQVVRQPKFLSMRIPSRSRIQDLFLNMTVSLGEAPAGKYNLKFTVRDLNSKKTVEVSQDVVLK